MTLSAIDICARALIKIGANTITSFTEGTAEAEVSASLYPTIRDALLSAHPWNFAIDQAQLSRLVSAPKADYDCAFQLPVNCIRVLSAGAGRRSVGLSYRVIGRELHASTSDVTLTFVRRPAEDVFPPFFTMALIAQLAAEFAIPLTDSTSRWQALRKAADEEFRRAKLIDAQEDTPAQINDFTLIEERF
ncbi:MAG: hypothetical protein H6905_06695 [Hyphomicrobiales bacterium]|nr:hypothetical protein [Hyphomicrobiales bacterium]